MKTQFSLKLTLCIHLFLYLQSCKTSDLDAVPIKIIEQKTADSKAEGSATEIKITATGGKTTLLGTTFTIPAGAMKTGNVLKVQPTNDPIDAEGKGFTIEGEWSKEITVSYEYGSIPDPENYDVFVRLPSGTWIGALQPTVNKTAKTVSVRIAPNTLPYASGARIAARNYSLAFAKTFYLKPETSVTKVGKSIVLTPYAKEGFIPVTFNGKKYNTQEAYKEAYKNLQESKRVSKEIEEEFLGVVPITRPQLNYDDEEITDVKIDIKYLAQEYPFANTKEGFKREWKVENNIGSVNPKGNLGGEFITNNQADKGKTALVSFTSVNTQFPDQNATARGSVTIDDGLEKYIGTIEVSEDDDDGKGNKGNKTAKY
ncbi:MAG: hypothetical protein ACRCVT_10630 [Leadbetterella sp.]